MSRALGQLRRLAIEQGLDALDVDVLLATVLEKPRSFLYAWPEHELSEAQQQRFQEGCQRRLSGEPVAYIVGEREFWSLPLKTAPHTLIPRPDTEVLVEQVLADVPDGAYHCVDLGTGTGAIALALKSERPGWQVEGIDRVPEAVALATENAQRLGLEVAFREGNWCADLADESIDILVSNPPYIDTDDEHLSQGDVRFEPESALVADQKGLADIATIILQAQRCLRTGGGVYIEHGWQQGDNVRTLLQDAGFERVHTRRDYGNQERVTYGWKRST